MEAQGNNYVSQRICGICGKEIWTVNPNIWGYKKGKIYFCSYSCMREYEKSQALKPIIDKKRKKFYNKNLKLKKAMEKMGYTQKRYAEEKGVSITHFAKKMNRRDKKKFSEEEKRELAEKFKIKVEDIE